MGTVFAGFRILALTLAGFASVERGLAADLSKEALAGYRLGEAVPLRDDDEVYRSDFQPDQVEFSAAPRRDASLGFDEQILHLTWERNLLVRLRLRWTFENFVAARSKANAVAATLRSQHPSMKARPVDASADFEGETTVLDLRGEEAMLTLTVIDEQEDGAVVEADFMPELHADFGMRLQQVQREDEEKRRKDAKRENARKR